MPEKVELPPFEIRNGETEEEARRRYIESLTLEQIRELVRQKAPGAHRYLAQREEQRKQWHQTPHAK
jgi:hypothetical protein